VGPYWRSLIILGNCLMAGLQTLGSLHMLCKCALVPDGLSVFCAAVVRAGDSLQRRNGAQPRTPTHSKSHSSLTLFRSSIGFSLGNFQSFPKFINCLCLVKPILPLLKHGCCFTPVQVRFSELGGASIYPEAAISRRR